MRPKYSAIERAVAIAGSESALARRVGVTPQAVQHWVRTKKVRAERAVQIEQACNGLVTRRELRPDLFGVP